MPDTIEGLIIATALILPGFVIAELSIVGRARGLASDLEVVLRALFYALILHLAASPATAKLVEELGPTPQWTDHLCALALYVGGVLILAPLALGSALGWYLRRVERREEPPGPLYAALGARDAGDAWDNIFQRVAPDGAWLIVELTSGKLLGGRFGRHSAVGQTPSPHDLFLQELWTVDDAGQVPNLSERIEPTQGIFISPDQIRSIRIMDPPYAT